MSEAFLSRRLQVSAVCGQADILAVRGDTARVEALVKEQEQICRELGDNSALARCLVLRAALLGFRFDLDGALEAEREGERICRASGDKAGLANFLAGQASRRLAANDLR